MGGDSTRGKNEHYQSKHNYGFDCQGKEELASRVVGGGFIKTIKFPIPTNCPYCEGEVILTENDFVYSRKFWTKGNCNCYACIVCKASVGTHPDGVTPLGRLADKELKALKKKAHSLFDPLWENGRMSRDRAYKWLSKKLSLPVHDCHFGHFDKPMLKTAISILEKVGSKS